MSLRDKVKFIFMNNASSNRDHVFKNTSKVLIAEDNAEPEFRHICAGDNRLGELQKQKPPPFLEVVRYFLVARGGTGLRMLYPRIQRVAALILVT